jgi:hypothetical protein
VSSWWIDIALCIGFAALAFLLIRMRQDLRRVLAHTMELLPAADVSPRQELPDEWPPHAALQVNSAAPPELRSRTGGGWALAVFGRDPAQIETVLPKGPEFEVLKSRYSLLAAVPDGSATGPTGEIDIVPIPERLLDGAPLPSVGMIDPEGLIQGIGSIADDFDFLAFVHEGEHHGFGALIA